MKMRAATHAAVAVMPARCDAPEHGSAGIALLPLLIGILIMLAITAYPPLVQRADGRADHMALMMLCWAMAAGFTRGVGLVPRNALLRTVLAGGTSLLALCCALLLRALGG